MAPRTLLSFLLLVILVLPVTTGCFRKKPVRYLASEVCLITPEQTTKEDVLTYLGPPNERRPTAEGSEAWIYHEVNRDLLRKTPYVGTHLGHEEYDVVTITFRGDVVHSCVYRRLDGEEYDPGGVPE